MKKIDYYKVLGIAKDANISDVKQAFRKLALQFHPDRHVGNNSSSSFREAAGHRFKEVSEAYEVLGDEVKRAAYDRAHYHHHHHHHPAGYDRSEGPPKRRYYRRTQEGYTTYGRATESSSTFYGERNNTGGVRWNSELSGPERRERIFNAIFLGVAVPLFLFADHIAESIWPTKKYVGVCMCHGSVCLSVCALRMLSILPIFTCRSSLDFVSFYSSHANESLKILS
jgi:hypothetical protein